MILRIVSAEVLNLVYTVIVVILPMHSPFDHCCIKFILYVVMS